MPQFHLNADLGEGCAYDAQIMTSITQANIACGGHAGNLQTMRESVQLALDHGVSIGAHPGYADPQNFGRVDLGLNADEVYDLVFSQVNALQAICQDLGATLEHVKPHGALYNRAAKDEACAQAIARAVHAISPNLVLMGLPGSCLVQAGRDLGLATQGEFFADRNYQPDGTLVPRTQENACIHDQDLAAARVKKLAQTGTVAAVDGTVLTIDAQTICLHGDSPQAVAFSQLIHDALF